MKNLVMWMIVTVFLAVSLPGVAFADDGHQCSVRTLRGTYLFSATGFTIDSVSGAVRPKAIVEVIEFGGDETLAASAATISMNGVISRPPPSVGTYTVAEDCTGSIEFHPGPAFDIFVAPGGGELWMIQTSPSGNVFEGSARRMSLQAPDLDPR